MVLSAGQVKVRVKDVASMAVMVPLIWPSLGLAMSMRLPWMRSVVCCVSPVPPLGPPELMYSRLLVITYTPSAMMPPVGAGAVWVTYWRSTGALTSARSLHVETPSTARSTSWWSVRPLLDALKVRVQGPATAGVQSVVVASGALNVPPQLELHW